MAKRREKASELYALRLDRYMKRAIESKTMQSRVVAIDNLFEVEREILRADVMELAHDRALEDSPHAFDGVCVRCAELTGEHIPLGIADAVVDGAVRDDVVDAVIAGVFVRRKQRPFRVDNLDNQRPHVASAHLEFADRLGLEASAALDGSDNRNLLRRATARRVNIIVATVPFARLPAHIGFIHFHQAGKQLAIVHQRGPDTVHHRPNRRPPHFEIARGLHRAQALLGIQHERDKQKPALKVDMRVVEDGPHGRAETLVAGPALPTRAARLIVSRGCFRAAIRASGAFAPPHLFKMGCSRFRRRKAAVDFNDAGHGLFSHQNDPASTGCVGAVRLAARVDVRVVSDLDVSGTLNTRESLAGRFGVLAANLFSASDRASKAENHRVGGIVVKNREGRKAAVRVVCHLRYPAPEPRGAGGTDCRSNDRNMWPLDLEVKPQSVQFRKFELTVRRLLATPPKPREETDYGQPKTKRKRSPKPKKASR